MRSCLIRILFLTIVAGACSLCISAQVGADNVPLFSRHNEEERRPKSFREGVEKMRIEKEKKEHEEMVTRGDDAAELADEIQSSFARSGSLSREDLDKVSKLEKLVKKIRDDLGGDDDGDADPDNDEESAPEFVVPNALPAVVDALKAKTDELNDLLKQTTRFTISASSIQGANTVLKITKAVKSRP